MATIYALDINVHFIKSVINCFTGIFTKVYNSHNCNIQGNYYSNNKFTYPRYSNPCALRIALASSIVFNNS